MRREPNPFVAQLFAGDVSATADTAAVVTVAADAAQEWVVTSVHWSYTAAPTGGSLTIALDGDDFVIDISLTGASYYEFPSGLRVGSKNTALVVTLAAGGGGISGKLCVVYS